MSEKQTTCTISEIAGGMRLMFFWTTVCILILLKLKAVRLCHETFFQVCTTIAVSIHKQETVFWCMEVIRKESRKA